MTEIKIFSGRSHLRLAEEICRKLNIKLSSTRIQEYANSCFEIILQDEVKDCKVFLIQTSVSQTLQRDLWELFQMISAAKENGAKEIIIVMPYVSYARSDKKKGDEKYILGMAVAGKLLVKLLKASGVTGLIGIDFHSKKFEQFLSEEGIKVYHLSALPLIAEYLKKKKTFLDGVLIPGDEGHLEKAILLAQKLYMQLGATRKKRIDDRTVVIENITGEIAGNDVIVFDDEISPAATTLKTLAKELRKRGAKSVTAAVTHASITEDTIRNLQKLNMIQELVATDTVPIPEKARELLRLKVLPVASLIAKKIKEISEEKEPQIGIP